jgi:nicotinate-nucleotide pyrophosphorylase (carboxylating)
MNEIVYDGRVNHLIEEAIREDLGMGDITTDAVVPPSLTGHAVILARETGVIAGLDIAALVFRFIDEDLVLAPLVSDGTQVDANTVVATVDGSVGSILRAERTALNILQRMSGIATLTRAFVEAVKGTAARITDTRKTAPGLRVLDKLGVRLGGGVNHRFGLDDMVLVKDNHIDAAGGLAIALGRCVQRLEHDKHSIKVEVEARSLAEVREALQSTIVNRIMLDNFSIGEMKRAVEVINRAVEVEASGNITLATVRSVAETGVDFISVGALTHSVKALDLSLSLNRPS